MNARQRLIALRIDDTIGIYVCMYVCTNTYRAMMISPVKRGGVLDSLIYIHTYIAECMECFILQCHFSYLAAKTGPSPGLHGRNDSLANFWKQPTYHTYIQGISFVPLR